MYRTFIYNICWCDMMIIADNNITYKDLVNNPQTKHLKESDYVGLFDFDDKFLKVFDVAEINGHKYYYRQLYDRNGVKKEYKYKKDDSLF